MKCEVINKCTLTVDKGSIVEVEPLQFELARAFLKPVEEEKPEEKTKPKKKK